MSSQWFPSTDIQAFKNWHRLAKVKPLTSSVGKPLLLEIAAPGLPGAADCYYCDIFLMCFRVLMNMEGLMVE